MRFGGLAAPILSRDTPCCSRTLPGKVAKWIWYVDRVVEARKRNDHSWSRLQADLTPMGRQGRTPGEVMKSHG